MAPLVITLRWSQGSFLAARQRSLALEVDPDEPDPARVLKLVSTDHELLAAPIHLPIDAVTAVRSGGKLAISRSVDIFLSSAARDAVGRALKCSPPIKLSTPSSVSLQPSDAQTWLMRYRMLEMRSSVLRAGRIGPNVRSMLPNEGLALQLALMHRGNNSASADIAHLAKHPNFEAARVALLSAFRDNLNVIATSLFLRCCSCTGAQSQRALLLEAFSMTGNEPWYCQGLFTDAAIPTGTIEAFVPAEVVAQFGALSNPTPALLQCFRPPGMRMSPSDFLAACSKVDGLWAQAFASVTGPLAHSTYQRRIESTRSWTVFWFILLTVLGMMATMGAFIATAVTDQGVGVIIGSFFGGFLGTAFVAGFFGYHAALLQTRVTQFHCSTAIMTTFQVQRDLANMAFPGGFRVHFSGPIPGRHGLYFVSPAQAFEQAASSSAPPLYRHDPPPPYPGDKLVDVQDAHIPPAPAQPAIAPDYAGPGEPSAPPPGV